MNLYEVTSRADKGSLSVRETAYLTSRQEAMKIFRELRKSAKTSWVKLNQVKVRTDIKAAEWCVLLQSDAPGLVCDLVPGDFIVRRHTLESFST